MEETTSTNDLAMHGGSHGDLFAAERQSAGRGQRGNKWYSGEGLNLTLSLVVEPQGLEATSQFYISQVAALTLVDLLAEYGVEARIKWTNDIYIGDRKIAGILIENALSGSAVKRSVVGIGLNVNQKIFDPLVPNPTSMALESGSEFDRKAVMERLHAIFFALFDKNMAADRGTIDERYQNLLYRKDEWHTYRLADGALIEGRIEGVEPSGALILSLRDGSRSSYQFKEIEFVIDKRGDR